MLVEGREEALILVKALPQTGNLGETVCCAGVTRDLQWRRQYPIRFRHLKGNARFSRWQWIEYEWRKPKDDPRMESRRVQEDSILANGVIPKRERSAFLGRLIEPCYRAAEEAGRSLTLIRPVEPRFYWEKKTLKKIAEERAAYEAAAAQTSFFDEDLQALTPCPYDFRYHFKDDAGPHDCSCGDWETAATYWRLSTRYGEASALERMKSEFGERYPHEGLAFAMGTHSRRPQWLLVGILKLAPTDQLSLI